MKRPCGTDRAARAGIRTPDPEGWRVMAGNGIGWTHGRLRDLPTMERSGAWDFEIHRGIDSDAAAADAKRVSHGYPVIVVISVSGAGGADVVAITHNQGG